MSSFATAASRSPERETTPSGMQPSLLVNPGAAPEIEAPTPETVVAAATSPVLDEAIRVERILTQLEARSQALVPYGYGAIREPAPRKSNNALLAGVLVALWLTSLILAVAYIRYVGHSPFAAERAAAAPSLVIAPENDPQTQKVAASVDHLAKALVTSSERMNQLQAAVDKSKRDLEKIANKVATEQDVTKVTVPATTAAAADTAMDGPVEVVEPTIPKNWHRVLNVRPSDAATPHKGADGRVDYWLVPRSGEALPAKVLTIGTSADGMVVHSLDDGKDYTLTSNGEWKNGSLASSASN